MPQALPASAIPTRDVDQVSAKDIPYADFLKRYVHANQPVVVTHIADHWPAMQKWTPEYFKQTFGDRVVPDQAPQSQHGYLRQLASRLMPPGWRRPDGFLKLLIGGPGSSFPMMHFDTNGVHATVTEIYGDKEFILFSLTDTPYLYRRKGAPNTSAIFDPTSPDLEQFPLLKQATMYRTVLEPGSMVFVPRGWWHTTRPLTHSISVGMNSIDGSNRRHLVLETFSPEAGVLTAGQKVKSSIKIGVYLALGYFMNVMEWLQAQLPGLARALGFPGLLVPAEPGWTQDPSVAVIAPDSRHVA